MTHCVDLSEFSLAQLRRLVAIKEQIEDLEGQIDELAGGARAGASVVDPTKAPAPAKRKYHMSAAHRSKLIKALAEARKARWAKVKAAVTASAPKKRHMSRAGRAAISAAAKARWARIRAKKGL
jgi:hypothetical protein